MNIYENKDDFTGLVQIFTDDLILHKKTFRFGIPEFTAVSYFVQLPNEHNHVAILFSRQGDNAIWHGVEKLELVSGDLRLDLEIDYDVEAVINVESGVQERVAAEFDLATLETLSSRESKARIGTSVFELSDDFKEMSTLVLNRISV